MRRVVLAATVFLVLLAFGAPASAADPTTAEITSAGPLTRIIISTELNCQVAHAGDAGFEFYESSFDLGSCGTFLAVDGTLYGPSLLPSGPSGVVPWTPVSQSPVTGAGTDADPFRVVTVVDAGSTGLRVEETDTYVRGRESYRTDVRITNSGANRTAILYRAGDCFLQDSDTGFGRLDAGAPACVISEAAGSRLEQWLALTPGSAAMEDSYDVVWLRITDQQPFPNTCQCGVLVDNGAGLSWSAALPGGGTQTFSHLTLFSPEGRRPLTTRLEADDAAAPAGSQVGYTITIENPNTAPVALDSIYAQPPAGFAYRPGSTKGATTADPATSGSQLTWAGPFQVASSGRISLHFDATAAAAPGDYRATAGGTSTTDTVTPAEQAALVAVGGSADEPLRRSVPGPGNISLDPVVVVQSAAIAAGVIALVPFPSALFNSTLEAHYDEIVRPILRVRAAVGPLFAPISVMLAGVRRLRTRRGTNPVAGDPAPFFATPAGIVLFILLSALLYGLLDPSFALDAASIVTFLGITVGLVATLILFGIPYARALGGSGVKLIPRALPGTLLVGAICVLVSRVTGFQPGYLYGLIIGYVLSRELSNREEGRPVAVATAWALFGSFLAWLLLAAARAAQGGGPAVIEPSDPRFGAAVLETACAVVVVAGLEAAVFAMLPIRFLPGEKVYAWNRVAWVVLLGLGVFGFCHVVLNPSTGYLADTTRVSLFTTVALLALFGLGSVLFWAFFRWHDSRKAAPPTTLTPP
jgi:hypothetical protein